MHCGYCRKEGHKINACPDKPADCVPPKSSKKRGRPKQIQANNEVDEIHAEFDLQEKEAQTGEANLMDDVINQLEEEEAWMRLCDPVQPKSAIKFVSSLIYFYSIISYGVV